MRSCDTCFYQGCGIKGGLEKLVEYPQIPGQYWLTLKKSLKKNMGEYCSSFRRSCSKCGAIIPSEAEFEKK